MCVNMRKNCVKKIRYISTIYIYWFSGPARDPLESDFFLKYFLLTIYSQCTFICSKSQILATPTLPSHKTMSWLHERFKKR